VLALALLVAACSGGGGKDSQPAQSAPPAAAVPETPVDPVTPPGDPETPNPAEPEIPAPADPEVPIPETPEAPIDDDPSTPSPSTPGDPWQPPTDTLSRRRDALRFLNQVTFGATRADLTQVQSIGYAAFLDQQFASPRTGYNGFNYLSAVAPDDCRHSASYPNGPKSLCFRDNYSLFELQRQFFVNAVTGRDQLRQRVAFALSQIFVVSGTDVPHAAGMASFQNMLLDHAFGNYRDLFEAVTLHPVMGAYLDMVNNAKSSGSRQANENYARECLQLFSIGTQQLNPDGTVRLDASGIAVAAYDQTVVDALAKAFTGWTYAPVDGAASKWTNPTNFVDTMVPVDAQHDTSGKTLFDGVILPAGQTTQQDLQAAIDAIFAHPNVGPFIARRLIQHLVTSNPTPAYVARVAAAFDDNGQGVRGDLRAVVRTILLDPEARGAQEDEYDFGRLKDPALFMTGFVRAFGGQSDGVYLRAEAQAMGQNIFTPPSVFSYYSPANVIAGTDLLGPEFGIYDSNRALRRVEFVYQMLYADGAKPLSTVKQATGTSVDLASLAALAGATPALLDELDARLMNARLSDPARQAVGTALEALSADDATGRARIAAYLLAISPQYQVQR
jgi:uncharacterized protein (DUF1800 family)